MAIDQSQVNAAAEALVTRKERVTLASVRDELGGGSFTTLSPLVKAWKEQHIAEAAAADELPEAARQAGEAAARSIWAAARADAAERIELIQSNADQRIADAETGTAEALAEVQRLEATIEAREAEYLTLEKTLDGARAARDESAATVQVREATIAGLKEQLAEQRTTAAAAHEKLDGLREQLAGEKSRAEAAQQNLEAERQAHGQTREAIDGQRSRADRAEERLALAQEAIETLTGERDALRAEEKKATRELETLRAKNDAATERTAELIAERDALRAEAGVRGGAKGKRSPRPKSE